MAVVEDHLLLAETLRAALERTGLDVRILPPEDPALLRAQLLQLRPELALVDLDLGRYGDGTPLIGALTRAAIRVLVVTGTPDRLRIAAALEQGAIGYQQKADGFNALLRRTGEALQCDDVLDPENRAALLAELDQARAMHRSRWAAYLHLTERERDTLVALADGRAVSTIARDWVVSEATVRTHVRALLHKLNVPSQLAAVALAVRSGWLSADNR